MIFGIVVEAERDARVYSTLIQRIRLDVDYVLTRPCQNVVGVRRRFVGWLKHFQWNSEYRVDKALVIRDSDCHDPQSVEDELTRILDQSGFREQLTFPVHFYATRCMVETWLLADEQAVNETARRRGRTSAVRAIEDPLEGLEATKELFQHMLSQAQLPADPAVYAEVAAAAALERVEKRCPYFRHFADRVSAC